MSLLERTITALKEAATRPVLEEQELEEVFEHIRCGTPLNEKWSDAARAASAAARKARAKGGNWRKAAVNAYAKSEAGRASLRQSFSKADRKILFNKRMADQTGRMATDAAARGDAAATSYARGYEKDYRKETTKAIGRASAKMRRVARGTSKGVANTMKRMSLAMKGNRRNPFIGEAAHDSELAEVFDHIEFGTPLNEKWSDAARAASAAARKARAKGGDWRKAATSVYSKAKSWVKGKVEQHKARKAERARQKEWDEREYGPARKAGAERRKDMERGHRQWKFNKRAYPLRTKHTSGWDEFGDR